MQIVVDSHDTLPYHSPVGGNQATAKRLKNDMKKPSQIYTEVDELNKTLGLCPLMDKEALFLDPHENQNDSHGDETLELSIIECSLTDQLSDMEQNELFQALNEGVGVILGRKLY